MKEYWVAFNSIPKIKTSYWTSLLGFFPSLKDAWFSNKNDLLRSGLPNDWIESFLTTRKDSTPEKIMKEITKNKIEIICITEDSYPKNLKEIHSPPFVLYLKGNLEEIDSNAIAIVGSRKGTDYGKRATFEISKELSESGITIISGLALGLDTEAHKGALASSGRTVAVLANGLENVYPASNSALANKIIESGCLISEQPLHMPPLKQNFPARNRIISGLSQGVLVTEAGENSGTLHTASFALEQNRQVYAIPGPIYNPLSRGPNNLIKLGAKPVTGVADILEDFGISASVRINKPSGKEEELIFKALKEESLHIDEISNRTEVSSSEISKTLTMMEIKNKVRHLGGMVYTLN